MTLATRVTGFTSGFVVGLGTVAALYVGGWLGLIGGIRDIIHAVNPFVAGLMATGIIKLFICDIVGFGIFATGLSISHWIKGDSHDNPKTS